MSLTETSAEEHSSRAAGFMEVRNLAPPIEVPNCAIHGVAAESIQPGGSGRIHTRWHLTSDDPRFHRITEGLVAIIENRAHAVGSLRSARIVLLVIKANDVGQLWIDTCATMMKAILADNRPRQAGTALFEHDIADVTAMAFPAVTFNSDDRVICLFRENWRFGLSFDFNPDRNLDVDGFERSLGSLHRLMRYSDMYAIISNEHQFGRLVSSGWFPFAEIVPRAFREMAICCQDGLDLAPAEEKLISLFDEERIDRIFERWMTRPALSSRRSLLKSALTNFKADEPIAVIKIILTELEGILRDFYVSVTGQSAKINELLQFTIESATKKAGGPDTLLWPLAFAEYLNSFTFAKFDPLAGTGDAGSRHAVGHGAAPETSYTKIRALQAILTLDQLTLYL